MKDDETKNSTQQAREEKELFSRLSVTHALSKEDIWATLEEKIDQTPVQKGKVIAFRPWAMAVAASISLLVCIGVFAKLYTTTVQVNAGQTVQHTLPDGSEMHINAETSISYAPYWWAISRTVSLEGEAFFEVEKGSAFQVVSPQGVTQVLGTSFNIYARNNNYQVFCATGKVRVQTPAQEAVVLVPDQFAEIAKGSLVKRESQERKAEALAWRAGRFVYNSTPLEKVLKDFERHYDTQLTIAIPHIETYLYTGLFNRSVSLKNALEVVCYSFELKLEENKEGSFTISEK